MKRLAELAMIAASAGLFGVSATAAPTVTQTPPSNAVVVPITDFDHPERTKTIDGVATACTGVGQRVRDEAAWNAFPVLIEFSNGQNDYLADETLAVTNAKHRTILDVKCEAPWVLMKLKPGEYHVTAWRDDKTAPPQGANFKVADQGQVKVNLRF